MFLVTHKNKKINKFMKMISIIENEEDFKKQIKKQLMEQIINDPGSIKAYKELEIYVEAEVNEEMEILKVERKLLTTYEEILNEIIQTLTKETKND